MITAFGPPRQDLEPHTSLQRALWDLRGSGPWQVVRQWVDGFWWSGGTVGGEARQSLTMRIPTLRLYEDTGITGAGSKTRRVHT